FLDGGVIDNKPFTYTLKEIFDRAADRRVDRRLFYVEPDPEHFTQLEQATQPNFLQAIISSLIGIPGYESISDDLKLLADHNSKLTQYRRLTHILCSAHVTAPAPARDNPQVDALYRQSRLISICDQVIKGLLKVEGRFTLLDPGTRRVASELIAGYDR